MRWGISRKINEHDSLTFRLFLNVLHLNYIFTFVWDYYYNNVDSIAITNYVEN